MALLVCAHAVGCVGRDPSQDPPRPAAMPVPAEKCRTGGDPSHRARHCEDQARARMDAYLLAPDQGPEALRLQAEVVACHTKAGDGDLARDAQARLEAWHARILQDYRIRHLRLEHALRQGHRRQAGADVRYLLALLPRTGPDPYVRWLERLSRDLP